MVVETISKDTLPNTLFSNVARILLILFKFELKQSFCGKCNYSQERSCPVVGVQSDIFSNNMGNLEAAISSNFPLDILCQCKEILVSDREFGQHLIVEVKKS